MPPLRFNSGLVLLLSASCALQNSDKPRPVVTVEEPRKADIWMDIASAADRDRISRVASAWQEGRNEATNHGFKDDLKVEGQLLDPAASLPRPAPTPGSYNCRLVTLGRDGGKGPAFQKFKPFFCYIEVEGDLFTIVKQTGSQRPVGRLWEDDSGPDRMIFLGTLSLGNEEEARAYGEDSKRDMAGIFERFGAFKWRLVIPYPQDGARLDVFELTPVEDQPSQ